MNEVEYALGNVDHIDSVGGVGLLLAAASLEDAISTVDGSRRSGSQLAD